MKRWMKAISRKRNAEAEREEVAGDAGLRERAAERRRRRSASGARISTAESAAAWTQRREQDEVAHVEQRGRALRPERQQLGQEAPFEEVEEVGPVVGRRRDRELVVLEERPRSGPSSAVAAS